MKTKRTEDRDGRDGRLTSLNSNIPSEKVLSSSKHDARISFVSGEAVSIMALSSSVYDHHTKSKKEDQLSKLARKGTLSSSWIEGRVFASSP